MGIVQKDAFRTMLISYIGIFLGYLNKGLLFLLVLSTEQIGLVNLIVSVGLLFAQFANMGTIYTTWKFLPYFKNEEKRHHGFLPLMLLIVCVGLLVCLLATFLFQPQIVALYKERSPWFVDYYYWMLPIGISYVLFMLFEVYLRSFYKNLVSVISLEIVLRLLITALLVMLWFRWLDFHAFVLLHSLTYLVPTLLLLVYLFSMNHFRFSWPNISVSRRFRKILFQFSAFNYLNTLGVVLVNALDVMMIAQFMGLQATGVYSTIVFLASALQVPYKSILRITSPMVADQWKQRKFNEMKALYQKVSSVSMVIGFTGFIAVWVNIDFLFGFLKPEFQPGIWMFFFLMMGRLVDMYGGLNGSIFTTSKKYKYDIWFTLLLMGTVFSLNYILIPLWGISGAAISTSIALIAYNLIRIGFVYQAFRIHPFMRNQAIIFLLACCAIGTVMLVGFPLDNLWLNAVIRTATGLLTFLAPIYFFNLEPETIAYVQNGISFLRKKKRTNFTGRH
jgi:O-antigen/teichoic acid export membrane protein